MINLNTDCNNTIFTQLTPLSLLTAFNSPLLDIIPRPYLFYCQINKIILKGSLGASSFKNLE